MNTILNFIHAARNVLLHSIRTTTFCWVTVALGSAVFLTDKCFNADADKNGTQGDAFGFKESGMDAAKLRQENVNAWKFTTLAPTNGMTDLQYLLQQKDGTVYLAMGYGVDSGGSSENLNGASVFLLMFRLTEKGVRD